MRGIVYVGEGKAELTDQLDVRAPGPTEVSVRIVAAGLCHTDLSVIDGTIPWPACAVLGHEGAGIVEEVGEAVTHVRSGDHVVVSTLAYCGACRYCVTGRVTNCRSSIGNRTEPFTFRGEPCSNFAATSSMAERIVVAGVQAVPIPRDIRLDVACTIACGILTGAGTVWNAADVHAGDRAVVFGLGGVGISAVQALKVAGASRIVAVDIEPWKEALAFEFGATDFVLATPDGDTGAAIRSLLPYGDHVTTGPFSAGGADWAFECVGHPALLRTTVEVLDWGGRAFAVGVTPPGIDVHLPVNHLVHLDRGLIGCRYGASRPHHDIPLIIDLYREGRFKLDELVSRRYPIEDWESTFADLRAGVLARGVLTF